MSWYIGTTNTMKRRSVPAIALNESNDKRGHYFMNLYTGKRLPSYAWEELPIDNDIIEQVEFLAKQEKAPVMTDGGYPMFEQMTGVHVDGNNLETNDTDDESKQLNENEEQEIDELHGEESDDNAEDNKLSSEEKNENIYITENDNDSDLSTDKNDKNDISYNSNAEDVNIKLKFTIYMRVDSGCLNPSTEYVWVQLSRAPFTQNLRLLIELKLQY